MAEPPKNLHQRFFGLKLFIRVWNVTEKNFHELDAGNPSKFAFFQQIPPFPRFKCSITFFVVCFRPHKCIFSTIKHDPKERNKVISSGVTYDVTMTLLWRHNSNNWQFLRKSSVVLWRVTPPKTDGRTKAEGLSFWPPNCLG